MLYEILTAEHRLLVSPEHLGQADIRKINKTQYHIIIKNNSYLFDIKSIDPINGTISIQYQHQSYIVSVLSPLKQKIRDMGFSQINKPGHQFIKSPMPGLILQIQVEEGQTVHKGDILLSLEAMKMENVMKAPHDGVIKKIMVKTQDKVDKNQSLIEFE